MCRQCILKACGLVQTIMVCMLEAEKQKTDPTFTSCRGLVFQNSYAEVLV